MNYIFKELLLKCSHPRVKKIHKWGAVSLEPLPIQLNYITLTMLNGERIDFEDFGNDEGIKEAERYLKSLDKEINN